MKSLFLPSFLTNVHSKLRLLGYQMSGVSAGIIPTGEQRKKSGRSRLNVELCRYRRGCGGGSATISFEARLHSSSDGRV